MQGTPFKSGNTEVHDFGWYTALYLHGNKIAEMQYTGHGKEAKKTLYVTNAGWPTNTTKERLNGLPGVHIQQIKGKWYLDGKEWDGKLIDVK